MKVMKRIFSLIFILTLGLSIAGCSKDTKQTPEVYSSKDGTFEITMYDQNQKLIETITVKYINDKINKVEYLINEENEEILEIDRKELIKLEPTKIVNSELALYAIFDDDGLEEKFLGLKKDYVYDYVENLKEENPNYTFLYNYVEE